MSLYILHFRVFHADAATLTRMIEMLSPRHLRCFDARSRAFTRYATTTCAKSDGTKEISPTCELHDIRMQDVFVEMSPASHAFGAYASMSLFILRCRYHEARGAWCAARLR